MKGLVRGGFHPRFHVSFLVPVRLTSEPNTQPTYHPFTTEPRIFTNKDNSQTSPMQHLRLRGCLRGLATVDGMMGRASFHFRRCVYCLWPAGGLDGGAPPDPVHYLTTRVRWSSSLRLHAALFPLRNWMPINWLQDCRDLSRPQWKEIIRRLKSKTCSNDLYKEQIIKSWTSNWEVVNCTMDFRSLYEKNKILETVFLFLQQKSFEHPGENFPMIDMCEKSPNFDDEKKTYVFFRSASRHRCCRKR